MKSYHYHFKGSNQRNDLVRRNITSDIVLREEREKVNWEISVLRVRFLHLSDCDIDPFGPNTPFPEIIESDWIVILKSNG